MKRFFVESPGLLTTVQDLGRPGFGPIGVSAGGAADPVALRVANLLLGNPEGAAGLEMTLQGGRFQFPDGAMVALGGAHFAASVDGVRLPSWETREILRGQVLTCGRTLGGARCYLCVRGGIRVPLVMGSAATDLVCGLGGLGGRPLRKGDAFDIGDEPAEPARSRISPQAVGALSGVPQTFRVTGGPQAGWFTEDSVRSFYSEPFSVTPDANRMGIRLAGRSLETMSSKELITEGVSLGSIQVARNGQPMILFVEQQTTGGYPKIANVIAADLPAVGRLMPGDEIRFQRVDLREAREILYIQERWVRSPGSYL